MNTYVENECFQNAVRFRNENPHLKLKLVIGSLGLNGWFEYGGKDGKRLGPDELHKKLETILQASRKVYKTIVDEATAHIMTVDLSEEFASLKNALKRTKPEQTLAFGVTADLATETVPSGLERFTESSTKPASEKVETVNESEEKEKMRSLREAIMITMVMCAFLTTELTLQEAFEHYKNNDDRLADIVYNVVKDRGLMTMEISHDEMKTFLLGGIQKVFKGLVEPYRKMRTQLEFTGDQKEVVEFIESNLMPKKEQVAARGEVFTPLSLVEEMLNKLPEDVWTHPEYKWLDPSNGIGNFPVVAFAKLDIGLASAIPDKAERHKHIVENMLYMTELDDTNVELSKNLLQKMCGSSECTFHLKKQDFLKATDEVLMEAFGVNRFDVIMGNPPYNPPKTSTGSSGNSIWQNFVMKCETLLNSNGYLCMVHPIGWKKPTEDKYTPAKFKSGVFIGQIRQGQVWQYFKNKGRFIYIYTNDQKSKTLEYLDNFPPVDFYIFQKDNTTQLCTTRNIFCGTDTSYTNVYLETSLPYLPCLITPETIDIVEKIIKTEGTRLHFQRYRSSSGFSQDASKPYKYIYTFGKNGERKYQYSDKKHENVSLSKIVMNFDGGIDMFKVEYIDSSENIGSIEMTMYMLLDSVKGKQIESFLNSNIIKFLFLITQYAAAPRTKNEPLVVNSIPIPSSDITDYYEFFGIQKYKQFIEETLNTYKQFKEPKIKTRHTTPRKKSPNATGKRKLKK